MNNAAVLLIFCLKVCVAHCPAETFSPLEASRRGTLSEPETKEKVREFCSSLVTEAQFDQLSLAELVRREMCPAWYLASSPVVGRCLPLPAHSNNSDSLVSLRCSPANFTTHIAGSVDGNCCGKWVGSKGGG